MDSTQEAREELGRRIKAARVYANLMSQKALAAKISDHGFSAGTIRNWERGRYTDPLSRSQLRTVAEACDLPPAFFSVDFRRLAELANPTRDAGLTHEQVLGRHVRTSQRRADSNGSGKPAHGEGGP